MSWSQTVRARPPPAEAPVVKSLVWSPPSLLALFHAYRNQYRQPNPKFKDYEMIMRKGGGGGITNPFKGHHRILQHNRQLMTCTKSIIHRNDDTWSIFRNNSTPSILAIKIPN
jgi:hypothetical protein